MEARESTAHESALASPVAERPGLVLHAPGPPLPSSNARPAAQVARRYAHAAPHGRTDTRPRTFDRFVQYVHWRVGWSVLEGHFEHLPAQARVAQLLLREGLNVRPSGVYAGDLYVSDSAISRASGVDRRIVMATIDTIRSSHELRCVFLGLQPTYLLAAAARKHGWGVIDILPADPNAPGLIAHAAQVLAQAGIGIRQVIAEDPDYAPEPHLYIVAEKAVPKGLHVMLARHPNARVVAVMP